MRAHRRQVRRQEKLERLLRPLLLEALTPVAQAMARLDQAQRLTLQALERLEHPLLPSPETELLLEVLNSLQPAPELELSQRLGLPMRPPTSLDSAN